MSIEQPPIATGNAVQEHPAVAYDPFRNRYLTVWDERASGAAQDLYGQFCDKEGLVGTPFKIVRESASQRAAPAVEFMIASKEYMIVWMDSRDGGWNIYGIRLDDAGEIVTSSAIAPGWFICDLQS